MYGQRGIVVDIPDNESGVGAGEVAEGTGENFGADDPRNTVQAERPAIVIVRYVILQTFCGK